MRRPIEFVVIFALAALAAGCGTKGEIKPEAEAGPTVEERPAAAGVQGEAGAAGEQPPETAALPGRGAVQVHPLDDSDSILAKRVIYFDYDKSTVDEEYRPVVAAHAEYLAGSPGAQVVLEGHADERGSREYNIGLGERRAEAVRRLLLFQGAADDQVRTVSYGEERPAVNGHDESVWAQNRRVELIYQR
ncbi:MAG: peptidoglycan-associated lipoprotein Pal [Gammaproteobacteria bacterium]|nr:peptidoglycan-associated lipoprotein Pal [Gammaproteobacteria bacterium]NIR97821.1 peptidoglycan-associated lipoprotein Pal [Gammaproteobacteria bacterium]NIT63521.1 peptidoglycan-associated lipoprotein Pal [Gammaproteobacteria bacterium]NIV20468.1 peptidoglycan-associated lipoprotein Pal [Gammaproteobacteria bacterium]NIX11050.1 peptidoglycan-associated lipoprotein Pal [Gammaproteobacteria bacterium]